MSDISFDIPEGYYLSPFTAKMILSGNVQSLQFSVNGAPPSISKYVAYDQLVPPNPFIAVTQDGTGNVVYDGGFPKFYNSSAPTLGINASITMEFRATCLGVAAGDNAYYYNAFSDKQVTIAIGDRLVYDMAQDNANARVGIDAITANDPALFPDQYSLRDWSRPTSSLIDQNGLPIHPSTNLGNRAVNQWYHREFDLSACAGQTFIKWSLAYEGEVAGNYATRFRDVYIVDRNGNVKTILFKDTIDIPGNSSTEVRASGYINLVKTLYDPRSQLTASFKYLYNAIVWTANPKKVAAGNRKILILGDAVAARHYAIKSTVASGFNTSLTRLCAAVGVTPTFKDVSDYTGTHLNPTPAELDQYACVILMSSVYGTASAITDAATQAMVAYREAGNGLIFITDHGVVVNNISQAVAASGFFSTANKVIVNFGAYFSGDYNRTPVNVGFLRSTYGNHPLYAGMTDDEFISAGGSESRVQVTSFTPLTPAQIQPFAIGNGKTTIRVSAILNSGEIVPYKIEYNVVPFKITFTDGVQVRDNGQVMDVGVKNRSLVKAAISGILDSNAAGILYKNGLRIGSFTYSPAGGSVQSLDNQGPETIRVENGDRFTLGLTTPTTLTSAITIKRFQPAIKSKRDLSDIMRTLREYRPDLTDIKRVRSMIEEIASNSPWLGLKHVLNMPINLKLLGEYFSNEGMASMFLASTHVVTVGSFNAPGPWVGFYSNAGVNGGTVSPTSYGGKPIRDMNASSGNIKGPMFFQLAFSTGLLPAGFKISHVAIDNLPLLPFTERMTDIEADRYFYGNGQINVRDYIASKVGSTITVRLYQSSNQL